MSQLYTILKKTSWKTSSRLRWCNNVLRCLKKVAPNLPPTLLKRLWFLNCAGSFKKRVCIHMYYCTHGYLHRFHHTNKETSFNHFLRIKYGKKTLVNSENRLCLEQLCQTKLIMSCRFLIRFPFFFYHTKNFVMLPDWRVLVDFKHFEFF